MSTKTLRAGLIGLGMMGRHHARNLRSLDGVELVAVADAAVSGAEYKRHTPRPCSCVPVAHRGRDAACECEREEQAGTRHQETEKAEDVNN